MEKKELLYEGKAKKVYTTEDPDVLIVDYKDDATAFNGLKKGTIQGKGVINNRMSNRVFQLLEKEGIPTHYVEELSDRETGGKEGGDCSLRGDYPECGGWKLFEASRRGGRDEVCSSDSGVQL